MAFPSSIVCPLAPVFSRRSLPPRSTIHSLLTSSSAAPAAPLAGRPTVILVKLDTQN